MSAGHKPGFGLPNALPFSSKPAAESASRFYTDVPAAGLPVCNGLFGSDQTTLPASFRASARTAPRTLNVSTIAFFQGRRDVWFLLSMNTNGILHRLAFLLASVSGCSGGCPLDHSELLSMNPNEPCLEVKGETGTSSQCVDANLVISNNCANTLIFADGWTANGGKLVFGPGESGHYDTRSSMKVAPNQYVTTAVLGQQTITFTIRTYPR
jgi:hypothetical protein